MSNTQEDRAERWTAPLRELEVRFKRARESILQFRPDEQVDDFGSMDGIETMRWDDLEILRITRGLRVRRVEDRAGELRAKAEEAERVRAETQRQENMSPLEARIEKLERANAYLAAEVNKLKGVQHGHLPALPHVARTDIPQMLGQPGGMGRPAARAAGGGDARLLQRGADAGSSASAPATTEPGFTRKQHPLEVIGSAGR